MKQPSPFDLALAQLAALDKERDELLAFIASKPMYERFFAEAASQPATTAAPCLSARSPKTSKEIVDAAIEIIRTKNRPVVLGDLYRGLVLAGVEIGGKDPRNNLSAKLYADDRVKTLPGLGWWIVNEQLPLSVRLDQFTNEEGPDTDVSRPLHSNGAAA